MPEVRTNPRTFRKNERAAAILLQVHVYQYGVIKQNVFARYKLDNSRRERAQHLELYHLLLLLTGTFRQILGSRK